jgi:hypothetical protein
MFDLPLRTSSTSRWIRNIAWLGPALGVLYLSSGADAHSVPRMDCSTSFQRVDVTDWEVVSEETGGADAKWWLLDPDGERSWLFKAVTLKGGHRHGEDWAEKASSHLADAVGVPCARVELATRGGVQGSISLNLQPPGYQVQPGYVVLQAAGVKGFRPGKVRGRPGHSLSNIQAVLASVSQPPGAHLPDWMGAFDVFAGYTMLDAWIASRDRHDENWSVLYPVAGEAAQFLCGSYDHGGGLGYNLRDKERQTRLDTTGGVEAWASKGTAWRLEHKPGTRPMTLVQAANQAFDLAGAETRAYWMRRLAGIDDSAEQRVFDGLPELSDLSRRFALTLLRINRRRILDDCG